MVCHMLMVLTLSAMTANRPDDGTGKTEKKGAEPQIADLSGYYTCRGVEAGGKTYSGVCVITKKGDIYLVQWMVGAGSTFTGVGIRQGDTFAASWAMAGERGLVRGVNMYRIEQGPRLIGRWASMPGPGYLQNETLTFLKSLDPEEE